MDLISQEEFEQLATYSNGMCVSIFIPTHRGGEETLSGKDAKELKSQLRDVSLQLKDLGWSEQKIDKFLKPAKELLEDSSYWRHNSDGLAVFIAEDFSKIYRLPVYFEPYNYISEEFYIRPLLPMRAKDGHFYVLAIGLKNVNFYECTKHTITEIDVEDLTPSRLQEAVGYDWEQSMVQFRAQQEGVPSPGAETGRGHFHGHGDDRTDKKTEILQFFHRIDDGIMEIIGDENDPLVVASLDYMFPIYEEANKYPHLWDENVSGNPSDMDAVDLHREAFKLLEPYFEKERKEKEDLFQQFKATEKASVQLEDVVPAAIHGKVDTLFIKNREDAFGNFLEDKNTIKKSKEHTPGENRSLLNLAAAQTILHGGNVYLLDEEEMPDEHSIACAYFRY